jgi:hypothetical protein
VNTALQQEHKLVTWAREQVAVQVQKSNEIAQALEAAAAVRGLVITTDAEAHIAEDRAVVIVRGQKATELAKRPLLDVLNGIRNAVKDYLADSDGKLASALQEINAAQSSHKRRQREEAVAEQRRREQEARQAHEAEQQRLRDEAEETRKRLIAVGAPQEAANAAANEVLQQAEEIVPLEDAPAAPPSATVRGSSSMSVAIKTLKAEIADLALINPDFVEIRQKAACDWARHEIQTENMAPPPVGRENAVKSAGVWWWYQDGRARRTT